MLSHLVKLIDKHLADVSQCTLYLIFLTYR